MEHWGTDPEGDWSMLEQEEWEPDAAFAERLGTTLARSSAEDSEAEVVLFVMSSRDDAPAMTERWSRANSLMSHLARFNRAQLVLTRGYGYGDEVDSMLSDLGEELREAWADAGVSVLVQLPERAPQSQIKTLIPPADADVAAA
jgi:hypothetical protein